MDKREEPSSNRVVNVDVVEDQDSGGNSNLPGNQMNKFKKDLINKMGELEIESDMEMEQRIDDSDQEVAMEGEDGSESWTANEKYEFKSVLKQAHESVEINSESNNLNNARVSKSRSDKQEPRKSSEMRRGAGTGTGYGRAKKERDNIEDSKNSSIAHKRDHKADERGLDSYYDQSQSQLTSQRSHFTSIEGPPKIYEEVMRQLEADIQQEDYEDQIKELLPYKQEIVGLKKELKSKEEVLEVKQILLEKQKTEIEDLQKNNKKFQEEVQQLTESIKKLEQENSSLQQDLKVSKSQNQRDKDKLQRLVNSRQGVQTTQQFHGPYDSYLEQKHDIAIEGMESGISGQSGQSAGSATSGQSDMNTTAFGLMKQASSVHQQLNNSYDGLSLNESRAKMSNELQYNTVKNVNQQMMRTHMENNFLSNANFINNEQLIDVNQLVHDGFQSMNHKNKKGLQLKNAEGNHSSTSGNGRHTRSGKSNSESRQRVTAKGGGPSYGLAAQALDSSRVKQLNQKSFLSHSTQQVHGGKFNKTQKQYHQNSSASGTGYQISGKGQVNSSSSVGGNQNTSTSKGRRGQKQSKHSSLEKFNPTLLYGTQSIPTINQQFYLGGYGAGNATQQLSGPQLQIKMNSSGTSQSIKKGNQTYNVLNVNSFTPDRLKSRQKLGMLQQDQTFDSQKSLLLREAQGYQLNPSGTMDIAQPTGVYDANDIKNTYTMTHDLADLNATQKGQSRSQSQLTQYNQSIGSNMKMPHQMQHAIQSKTGTGKKQSNKMGVVSLAGMNTTLQAAHNSSQKLTSKAQLQNIYNAAQASQHKQYFRGNKNQHLPNPPASVPGKFQVQNSRNATGLKNNYKTMGATQDGDFYGSQPNNQQLRASCTQNLQVVPQHDINQQINCYSTQKQQKSTSITKQTNNQTAVNNGQQNANFMHDTTQKQHRVPSDASNGLNNNLNVTSFVTGQKAVQDTASTGATGGTTGANGGVHAQRRCSSQLQNRQQPTGGKYSKDLNKREMSSRANKNQSQNSNYVLGTNSRNLNKANLRSTISGSKPVGFANTNTNTITQSLNNTQKMRKGDSSKRGTSNRKSGNLKGNNTQYTSNFNSNNKILSGNQHSKYEQIQNILMKKNQNITGEARFDQQKTLSASSSNNAMSSLNNTLNNYQMINYNQQSQKNILNTTYMFGTNQQQSSIPQKKKLIPGREDNSQSALSLTQHYDQAITHTQSINNKEVAQEEFYAAATAEKDRYKQGNSSSKFKNPPAKQTNQGSARLRNSSYNSRQGKNSNSSGTRIYSANNFMRS